MKAVSGVRTSKEERGVGAEMPKGVWLQDGKGDAMTALGELAVLVNFCCLGVVLGGKVTEVVAVFLPVNFQLSKLILLAAAAGCVALGKLFNRLAVAIPERSGRFAATASTFIFSGLIISMIMNQLLPGELWSVVLPAVVLIYFRHPNVLPPGGMTGRWGMLISLGSQVIVLALLTRPVGSWTGALVICGTVYFLAHLALSRWWKGYRLDRMVLFLDPLLLFFFLFNLANQILPLYEAAGRAFAWAAAVTGILSFVMVAILDWRKIGGAWPRRLHTVFLGLFFLAFLCDININYFLELPPETLNPHLWFHTTTGLDFVYNKYKPFIDYYPTEGVWWQTLKSRLWLQLFNQSLISYFLMLFALGVLGHLLYIGLFAYLARSSFRLTARTGILIGYLLCVTNINLVQLYVPNVYAWCLIERAPAMLLATLVTCVYLRRLRKTGGGGGFLAGLDRGTLALALLVGALHACSFLAEVSFGVGNLMGLFVVTLWFNRKFVVPSLCLWGGVLTVIVSYLLCFQIPPLNFFWKYPVTLLLFGKKYTDPDAQYSVFQAFDRDNLLLSLHHSVPLLCCVVFVALLWFGAHRHRLFTTALYLFAVTFSMLISRGAKLFLVKGIDTPLEFLHHPALSLILFFPFCVLLLRLCIDCFPVIRQRCRAHRLAILTMVVLFSVNGLFISPGVPAGLTTKFDLQNARQDTFRYSPVGKRGEFYASRTVVSWSPFAVLRYFFHYKNREFIMANYPRPLQVYYRSGRALQQSRPMKSRCRAIGKLLGEGGEMMLKTRRRRKRGGKKQLGGKGDYGGKKVRR